MIYFYIWSWFWFWCTIMSSCNTDCCLNDYCSSVNIPTYIYLVCDPRSTSGEYVNYLNYYVNSPQFCVVFINIILQYTYIFFTNKSEKLLAIDDNDSVYFHKYILKLTQLFSKMKNFCCCATFVNNLQIQDIIGIVTISLFHVGTNYLSWLLTRDIFCNKPDATYG